MSLLSNNRKWKRALILPAAALLLAATGCRVEKEQAGEMPDVDVNVEPGSLPEYDVEGPDVEVGTEQQEVTVPEVNITTEEETVTVPDVDVDLPTEEGE